MTQVKIGGTEYEIGEMTFKGIKAAWPLIKKNQELATLAEEGQQPDPIEAMQNAIGIISCGLMGKHPEMTSEHIEETITARECQLLDVAIVDIMVESGFMQRGNVVVEPVAAPEGPSTETSTD